VASVADVDRRAGAEGVTPARASAAAAKAAVAVIGAGWAGLSAALTLAEAGVAVTLFDSAPLAGGRARTTVLDTPLGRFELDNGQHLIVGAYTETLALIERLGAAGELKRHRLDLSSPSGLSLRVPALPAPLHTGWALLRARGLSGAERLAMVRLMRGLQRAGWRTGQGETVEALLRRWQQPARLIARLWAPLCIGALNTLPEHACARSFSVVLRDTLGASRPASDFVTAERPLGSLLPEPALARLRQLGASIRLRETVRTLRPAAGGWELPAARRGPPGQAGDSSPTEGTAMREHRADIRYDAVLLALPPWSAARLLAPLGLDVAPLQAFQAEPIATAWAFWPADTAPDLPRWSLLDEDASRGCYGQWLFDRGVVRHQGAPKSAYGGRMLDALGNRGPVSTPVRPAGSVRVAGIVISVASRVDSLDTHELERGIAAQLVEAFAGPPPAAVRIVTERRATFRCTPGRPVLAPDCFGSEAPGLWLAGDWLWPDYPATLEAAVRSGRQVAEAIMDEERR
jgi:squalene-associated FAD-dependent desaturase